MCKAVFSHCSINHISDTDQSYYLYNLCTGSTIYLIQINHILDTNLALDHSWHKTYHLSSLCSARVWEVLWKALSLATRSVESWAAFTASCLGMTRRAWANSAIASCSLLACKDCFKKKKETHIQMHFLNTPSGWALVQLLYCNHGVWCFTASLVHNSSLPFAASKFIYSGFLFFFLI